jgi:hypothetical protein
MSAQTTVEAPSATFTIIHDATLADVERHELSPGLTSLIRSPIVRRRVLRDLAAMPGSRLTLAVADGAIVGHLAVAPSFGRWVRLPRVREIAFEVASECRRLGLLTRMMDLALADRSVEDEILLAFLWPSAWDVEQTGLQPTSYRRLLTELGERGGFLPVATDEPEIAYGGALLARVGARVPSYAVAALKRAQFLRGAPHPAAA